MIIIREKGGLGNQLFQYAAGYSMAKRLGTELRVDKDFYPKQTLRGYKLDFLNTDFKREMPPASRRLKVMRNKYVQRLRRFLKRNVGRCGYFMTYLLETRSANGAMEEFWTDFDHDVYMDGYFQTELYFDAFRSDLIRQFVPNYEPPEEFTKMLEEIESCNSVAVHVRRGDFLKAQNDRNPNHYLLGSEYYENAIEFIKGKVKDPQFYWFSDDIDWVREQFGNKENFHFVRLTTAHADIDEMMLMKNCKHVIAANSTFSWWGAWLNENKDAVITVPARKYGNAKMIPERWVKIDVGSDIKTRKR